MYYHASPIGTIAELEPRISNHGVPLIYFTKKRENALVYLSNAIEKYCKDTGFRHEGRYQKWGPYGFEKNGLQRIEEYYPGALIEAYQGVSGYIYGAETVEEAGFPLGIRDAAVSDKPVPVDTIEFVPDAYEAILKAEKEGLITVLRYENRPPKMDEWLARTIPGEFETSADHPEYRHFLKAHFPEILKDCSL